MPSQELNAVDSVSPFVVDFEAMAAAQNNFKFLSDESPHHSFTLHPIPLPNSTISVICDASHGIPCPVPPFFRKVVLIPRHRLRNDRMQTQWQAALFQFEHTAFLWPLVPLKHTLLVDRLAVMLPLACTVRDHTAGSPPHSS